MIEWITNNVAALTLLTTLLLILITLYYTILNRRMLEVSSRPCVLIDPKKISLAPDINIKCNTEALEEDLKEQRIWFNIDVDIANLSNSPAQDVFLDAKVHFIVRKPFKHAWLPVDKPKHLSFISSESSSESDNKQTINICFDNFVVREMLYDFCEGRKQLEGHAVHASHDEIQNKKLWTSPRIVLTCYYKDIQSINYCSEYQFFFHLYFDESESKLKCYILNIEDLGFLGIKKIRSSYRKKHLKKIRHLRYASFWGDKFSKKDLVVLRRAKQPNKTNIAIGSSNEHENNKS
jgi:glycosyltransferase involved in cell wall biosynthesis